MIKYLCRHMRSSARQLASFINATIDGDPDIEVTHPSKIEEAGPGSVSFIGNPKYESYAYTTGASILVVSNDFAPLHPLQATLLRVPNVYQSLSTLLSHFESNGHPDGISAHAIVDPAAKLGDKVSLSPYCVVESNVIIGDHTIVYPHVYLGHDVVIGKNCILHAGVKVHAGCVIGDGVIVQANSVIGSEGFGFVQNAQGNYEKMPQLGNVVLQDRVEIGANCTIDRGTMGSTLIKFGSKLDNLIHIAHNVEIGENTVIAAQTGVAGSAKIGARCKIGGQVGFVGHIQVPDDTQIQGQSGIMSIDSSTGQKLFGSPAIAYYDFLKSYALFKNLPELEHRLRDLEKKLKTE